MKYEKAIRKLSRALRSQYGSGIRGIRVFGSVARGTDNTDSDIDIMVIIGVETGSANWRLERAIRGIAFPIEIEEDVVFDLKVVSEQDLRGPRGHTLFMERVELEGIAV